MNDAKIIDHSSGVRQQFTDPCTMLSILVKLEIGTRQWEFLLISRHTRKTLSHPDGCRQVLAKHFIQLRLVIKKIKLRTSAILKQVNNSFCSRCKMGETCHWKFFFTTFAKKVGDQ